MKSVKRLIEDEQALLSLATEMAQNMSSGLVIYLEGNLGTGKTVLAKGFLSGLGYGGLVKSPTYSLVESYIINPELSCYHFDLYRLSDGEELEFAGSRDYFDNQSICLIEWPERATGFIPLADIICELEYHGTGRKITITAGSECGELVMLQCFPN